MIVDLFAGPGGWSEGLAEVHGRTDLGLELDADACATHAAASHSTIRADVASYPPDRFAGRVEGLIASPPCQAFSSAGKRGGTRAAKTIRNHVIGCARGWQPFDVELEDPAAELVLEPLRWVAAVKPRWVALEQVTAVLPLWHSYDVALSGWGYSVWSGELNAADYGVPQTRKRAVLVASLDRRVGKPKPTHSSAGSTTRERWVTMADGLGWDHGRMLNTGRDWKPGGSHDDAQKIDPATQPAPTLTAKAGGQWFLELPGGSREQRVTIGEACLLQSFPADYPVVGTLTSQYRQIGNAVPPLLAGAVLAEVL